jgi:hypothetical protein
MTDRDKLIEAMATAMVGETVMSDRVRGWNDFAQAALTALEALGLAGVPREPTEAMLDAGYAVDGGVVCVEQIYRAMLAAAPLPAAPNEGEG